MFRSQCELHLKWSRVNEERLTIAGTWGQEGTVVGGKAGGTGRPVAAINNEARTR